MLGFPLRTGALDSMGAFPHLPSPAGPVSDQQLTLQWPHGSWVGGHRCFASLEKELTGLGFLILTWGYL